MTKRHDNHNTFVCPQVSPPGNVPQLPLLDNAMAGLLVAVWCRAVGSVWTLELREPTEDTPLGTIKDWISSGVPISQPPPQTLASALLAEHGLTLVSDLSASLGTPTRHPIGYVCTITELQRSAGGRYGNDRGIR